MYLYPLLQKTTRILKICSYMIFTLSPNNHFVLQNSGVLTLKKCTIDILITLKYRQRVMFEQNNYPIKFDVLSTNLENMKVTHIIFSIINIRMQFFTIQLDTNIY